MIASSMKEVTVSEGSTAILQCAVSSSPLPTVTWYKGTSILQVKTMPTVTDLTHQLCH